MSLSQILKENKEVPELGRLRDDINRVDKEIIELLAERTDIVKKIADIKDEHNAKTVQKNRWQQVLDRIEQLSSREGLNPKYVKQIWNAIHKQSVNAQEDHRS